MLTALITTCLMLMLVDDRQSAPVDVSQPAAPGRALPKSQLPAGARPIDVRQNAAPIMSTRRYLQVEDLMQVEPKVSDTNQLAAGGRVVIKDLRTPQDFKTLYRVPLDAPSKYAGWFVRAQGAIMAVFPASAYLETDEGTMAPIPGGTVYLTGGIPLDRMERTPSYTPPVDVSVKNESENLMHTRVGSQTDGLPSRVSGTDPAIVRERVKAEKKAQADAKFAKGERPSEANRERNEQRWLVSRTSTIARMFTDPKYAASRLQMRLEQAAAGPKVGAATQESEPKEGAVERDQSK